MRRVDVVEQTEFDSGRVFGKNREIDAVAEPGRAKRIWFSRPGLNRCHNVRRCYPSRHRNAQSGILRAINRVCVTPPMNKLAIIKEFLHFLRVRKKWWIAPILIFLLLLGGLLIFANSSVLAPFIYSLF